MSEVDFESLNLKSKPIVKDYSVELQREIYEYLSELDEIHRKAYEIAYDHLGTSFNIARSNGFKIWKAKKSFT